MADEGCKVCFVPVCSNTSENCDKIFLPVPNSKRFLKRGEAWYRVARAPYSSKPAHCCEDHFDLNEDAQDFERFWRYGQRIFLKVYVVPHLYIRAPPERELPSQLAVALAKHKQETLKKTKETKDESNMKEEEIWSEIKLEPEDITFQDEVQTQEEAEMMEIKQEPQDDYGEYNIIAVNQHHLNGVESGDDHALNENSFEAFMDWCLKTNAKNYSEEVLMGYFVNLVTQCKLKTSLWSHFLMLQTNLSLKEGIDISKYFYLMIYIRKQEQVYTPRKSQSLSKAQFDQFLNNAPDDTYLGIKVVMIVGIAGACSSEEMTRIRLADTEDLGSEILVKIMQSKTDYARSFKIVGGTYLTFFRKYISLHQRKSLTDKLFMTYRNGKCLKQVMGVRKIAYASKEAALFLKLKNHMQYTGHSLSKSSAPLWLDDGADNYSGAENSTDINQTIHHSIKMEHKDEPKDKETKINWTPPPDITETVEEVINKVLPKKPSFAYENAFKKFNNWCSQRNKHDYSEEVLLAYFADTKHRNSLWSHYPMIRATLSLKTGIDIAKYENLRKYLKKRREDYKPRKTLVLSKAQFDNFFSNAPDKDYLALKIVMIFAMAGACSCAELEKLRLVDIEDLESEILVNIPDSKRKKSRYFNIVGNTYLTLIRKYASLRPDSIETDRFLIKYQEGKCYKDVMGAHRIATASKDAALYLGLPNHMQYCNVLFTGYMCMQRTGLTE